MKSYCAWSTTHGNNAFIQTNTLHVVELSHSEDAVANVAGRELSNHRRMSSPTLSVGVRIYAVTICYKNYIPTYDSTYYYWLPVIN